MGIEPGSQVTEEHLFRMLGMVQDPLTGEQLGRPPCAQKEPYAVRVRTRIGALTAGLVGDEGDVEVLKIKSEERTTRRRPPVPSPDSTSRSARMRASAWPGRCPTGALRR